MSRSPDQPPSRGISLRIAVSVIVGNMIGMGVFLSLGFQAASFDSPFVIAMLWLLGGLFALLGGLCYAELGAAIPKSGGEYQFLSRIYSPVFGFMAGWVSLIAGFPGPVALYGLSFGVYLCQVLGWDSLIGAKFLGSGLIVILTFAHFFTLRLSGRTQFLSTLVKFLLLLGIVVICLFFNPKPQAITFAPGTGAVSDIFSAPFVSSLYWVFFAYSGWNSVCYIAEEVDNPRKNLPRAIWISVGMVTIIYVAVNCAMLLAAPIHVLGAEENILQPAMTAAVHLFGAPGGHWMGAFIAIGLVATVSAVTWVGPRVSQAMGRDFEILAPLGKTNAHGVPTTAVALQSFVALLILWRANSPSDIINYVEFLLQASLFLTVLGVLVLRHREPDLPRPFRVPLGPVIPLVYCACIGWILGVTLASKAEAARYGLAALAAGIAVYLLAKGENRAASK